MQKCLHFSHSSDAEDKLRKIRPVLDCTVTLFKETSMPAKELSIDESMILWKGRLFFRQYMPAKPVKWGIKLWMVSDAWTGFICNLNVYCGKEEEREEKALSTSVVLALVEHLFGNGHHIYFDNY
eukprot:Pompholyxophrys_punicea_v1_NODE_320_length_2261_cov_3.880326.p1 type:complete len:125 gc:universal NODE_320_length_2261_cov_3.880326:1414-1040(-)